MLLVSKKKRSEREAAGRLYAAVMQAARRPAFYRDLGVPDTLDGRFEMVALHLFPPIDRLMHEPGDDPDLARRLSESFVSDIDAAFREMGMSDTVVPKKMRALYRSFAGRIEAYNSASREGTEALAGAIARNVFADMPEGQALKHAGPLALYALEALAALRNVPLADLRAGTVAFPDLPAQPDMERR